MGMYDFISGVFGVQPSAAKAAKAAELRAPVLKKEIVLRSKEATQEIESLRAEALAFNNAMPETVGTWTREILIPLTGGSLASKASWLVQFLSEDELDTLRDNGEISSEQVTKAMRLKGKDGSNTLLIPKAYFSEGLLSGKSRKLDKDFSKEKSLSVLKDSAGVPIRLALRMDRRLQGKLLRSLAMEAVGLSGYSYLVLQVECQAHEGSGTAWWSTDGKKDSPVADPSAPVTGLYLRVWVNRILDARFKRVATVAEGSFEDFAATAVGMTSVRVERTQVDTKVGITSVVPAMGLSSIDTFLEGFNTKV